ncbi:MAG: isoaspartyl peptidase/L-asparaginase, partial [Ralstonia sp.]|nr:isoaspartyl peptidase/L-asparaginase [Ralstonia sp.]
MTTPILAIHGGAGTITRTAMSADKEAAYQQALHDILAAGQRILVDGGSAVDAVTEAVRLLEECPLFNAGKGAVLTSAGTYELDASIMDGARLAAGAVTCVKRLRNPILAARAVMERSEHVLFTSEGAEAFAQAQGLEFVEPDYYYTEARYAQWQRARQQDGMALLDHDAASLVAKE